MQRQEFLDNTVDAALRVQSYGAGYKDGEVLIELPDPDNPKGVIYKKVIAVDPSTAFPVIDDDGTHPAARLILVAEA